MPHPLKILLIVLLVCSYAVAEPLVYQKRWVRGEPVHVVTVDLRSEKLAVRPLLTPAGKRADFKNLLGKNPPLAAINGTFFDTRSSVVVGNLVSEGRLLAEGTIGTTLVIDRHGRGDIINSAGRLGRYHDWSDVGFGISGGPTLLVSGEYLVSPRVEGFRDPALFLPTRRTALGLTANNKLLLVSIDRKVSLWQTARIMKDLGARQALNLDGGSSSALFYRGNLKVAPQRQLTNLVGVFRVEQAPAASKREGVLAERALAHYQKGTLLLQKGALTRARSQLRQAISKDPNQARYWSAYARSEELVGGASEACRAYLRAAQLYQKHYKLDPAMKMAQRAVAVAPHRADAQLLFGLTAHANGQLGLARQALQQVLKQHPGHPRATQALVEVKTGLRKLQSSKDSPSFSPG